MEIIKDEVCAFKLKNCFDQKPMRAFEYEKIIREKTKKADLLKSFLIVKEEPLVRREVIFLKKNNTHLLMEDQPEEMLINFLKD